ncbi:hypothetical protein NHG98_01730 [Wolbachia endosymbiont of Aedes albopictus]|uniref:hypothetical protein n=1 Tax=Wolbachia endosymbiont of Aedes albopictus TaxID=167957 RepID=UPI002167E46B|nr:hypothetical protein [Wolbachia endosymbiont of Aedes albopictus]UVW84215.1 hypothetical protein NHG98_01730 [Wolbachia endosymbiont of Aedes albopictus]
MTLESSLYYAATWLKLSLLDPSVSYSDDKVCFCHPMIALKNLDPSVTHWDDRGGCTIR